MRFTLIDRIIELEPGAKIAAVKALTLGEEYLADHFPRFPVMPGVLMLEAMTQAGAWLVRSSEDFAHSMVVLKQAANVKYGQFVEPGQTLIVTAEILSQTDRETKLKANGKIDGQLTVSARLVLERYNLAERSPNHSETDVSLKRELREQFRLLYHPRDAASVDALRRTSPGEALDGNNGHTN
jgi:3-hydroxyacyl-[acyl-carrier-protein] dehydratase